MNGKQSLNEEHEHTSMKFLAFTDIHQDKKVFAALLSRAQQEDIDFVLCAGDFSTFGRGAALVLEAFQKLGKKLYLIPGNHEEGQGWDELIAKFPGCVNLHLQAVEIGKYVFLGYGGGGFAQEDERFRKIARTWYGLYQEKKIVLVTHGPPLGTQLDLLDDRHVGNKDYRAFILRINPKLAISGHLHETVGVTDKLGETQLVNPGWDGMVIELK
ncbi:metallophosphoesterase [Candidatus Woesearchaeota archaeon]|nr:metallophosphoesterase [Candidatus Woesearchaeota archaeon]